MRMRTSASSPMHSSISISTGSRLIAPHRHRRRLQPTRPSNQSFPAAPILLAPRSPPRQTKTATCTRKTRCPRVFFLAALAHQGPRTPRAFSHPAHVCSSSFRRSQPAATTAASRHRQRPCSDSPTSLPPSGRTGIPPPSRPCSLHPPPRRKGRTLNHLAHARPSVDSAAALPASITAASQVTEPQSPPCCPGRHCPLTR